MKFIRNILIFITIIFGLIMQTEIYQNELYGAGAYFLNSDYEINENFDSFIDDIEIVAEKHNGHIFVELFQIVSTYESKYIIYGNNEIIRNTLKDVMDVEEGTYTALISGVTTVEFKDFEELKNVSNIDNYISINYIGDEEDIDAVYQVLTKTYSLSEPDGYLLKETDMILIVWGMIAMLMLALNVVLVTRKQKEVVVRASFGESAGTIALKSALVDIVSYTVMFVLAKLLVSQFVSGFYESKLVLLVYFIGAIISLIPYIAFVLFDVRKAFANASDKVGMFYLMNALKVVATIMTILTITTNLASINSNFIPGTKLLKNYYNDYYFQVMVMTDIGLEEEEEEGVEYYDNQEEEVLLSSFW